MATSTSAQPVSRRDVVRGAVGLGMLAPVALGAPSAVGAQEETHNYSGHPVVGVWFEGGPTFEYDVFHADGTFMHYNPWVAYHTNQGDPKLPTMGFGVWRPTGERTFEAAYHVVWGDSSVTSLMKIWGRGTVDDAGDGYVVKYRLTMVDSAGKTLLEDAGDVAYERFNLDSFEMPATPEAT